METWANIYNPNDVFGKDFMVLSKNELEHYTIVTQDNKIYYNLTLEELYQSSNMFIVSPVAEKGLLFGWTN